MMAAAHSAFSEPERAAHRRAIIVWLVVVALMVFGMVMVGGATRLTHSGLSITEWQPLAGALPPLSDAQWQAEFQNYQQIPQYKLLNEGMSLDDFKSIFWWEWGHRELARTLGAVMILPFLFFWWRGWIERGLMPRLGAVLALTACEPVLGWWMVSSGLADRTSVAQERLAMHMTLACMILVAIVWAAGSLVKPTSLETLPGSVRRTALALLGLVIVQIFLGGLVAGLNAGLTYNTWPLMDGHFLPSLSNLYILSPAWTNHVDNALTVQFQHRMVAYLVLAVAVWHAFDLARRGWGWAAARALVLANLVIVQAAIGIMTLLLVVPMWSAMLHQAWAVVVLVMTTIHAQATLANRGLSESASQHSPAMPLTA